MKPNLSPADIARLMTEDFDFGSSPQSGPQENPAMGFAPSDDSQGSPVIDGRANRIITKIQTCNAVTCCHNNDKRCILSSIELGENGACGSFEADQEAPELPGDQKQPADRLNDLGQDMNNFMTSQYDPDSGMQGL